MFRTAVGPYIILWALEGGGDMQRKYCNCVYEPLKSASFWFCYTFLAIRLSTQMDGHLGTFSFRS